MLLNIMIIEKNEWMIMVMIIMKIIMILIIMIITI